MASKQTTAAKSKTAKPKKPTVKRVPKTREAQDKSASLSGISHAISGRKGTKAQREFEQQAQETLINSTHDLIWSVSRDFKLITANQSFIKNIEYSSGITLKSGDSMLNKKAFSAELITYWENIYKNALAGESLRIEIPRQTKNNPPNSWLELSVNPIWNKNEVVGVACFAKDISTRKQMEAQREFERQEKEALINSTQDLIWSVSRDFKLIAANQSFINSVKGFSGKTPTRGDLLLSAEIFSPELISFWEGIYNTALAGEIYSNEFFTPATENSQPSWLELSINPIWDKKEVVGIACFGKDITAHKQAEEKVRKSEEQYRALFDQASDGIFIANSDGQYVDVNSAACSLLGYTREEILQLSMRDVLAPTSETPIRFEELKQGNLIISERELIRKDRTLVTVEISAKQLPDGRLQGIVRDITERKQAQKVLHDSEEKLRDSESNLNNILQTMAEGMVMIDLTGQIIFANRASENILGISKDEVTQKYYSSREWNQSYADGSPIPPDKLPLAIALTEKRFVKDLEHVITSLDGEKKWISVNAAPLVDEKNEIYGAIAGFSDITARKQADEAMRFHAALLNAVGQAVIATDANGIITYLNSAAESMYGWKADEALGRNILDVTVPEVSHEQAADLLSQLTQGKAWAGEFLVHRRDGSIFPALVHDSPILDEAGKLIGIIGVSSDITERKQTEEALRENQARLEMALIAGNQGTWLVDWQKKSNIVDERWAAMLGYNLDEVEQTLNFWESKVHPDDLKQLYSVFEQHERGEIPMVDVEVRARTKSGEWKWISDRARILKRTPDGKPWIMAGIHSDITERKKAEEVRQRLAAIVESSEDAIISRTLEGVITSWNDGAVRLYGYTAEEAIGQPISFLIPADRAHELPEILKRVQHGENINHFETLRVRKDGVLQDISLTISPTKDAVLQIDGVSFIARDITERKQVEEALRNKETQIRTLSDNLPNGYMYQIDFGLQGETRRFNYVSAGVEKLHGITVQQVLDDPATLYDQMLEEDRAAATEEEAAAFASMSIFQIEARHRTVSGQMRWMLLTSTPRKLSNQHIVWDGVALDITERKQMEKSLHETQSFLTTLLNVAPLSIYVITLDNRFQLVNHQWEQDTQISHKNAEGHLIEELFPMELARKYEADNRKVLQINSTLEVEEWTETPNGMRCYYTLKFPLHNASGILESIGGVSIDITERMLAEDKVKASLLEKETMLKEIHHRVKNNLQVITSLLYLQSRTSTDAHTQSMFSDSQNRISSMALIHEKLYQSADLAHIAFGDYIRDLGHSLLHTYGIDHSRVTLTVEADEISLDINNAVPCGLIINEIIANSLKYAFPDQRKGNIRVTFSLEPADRFMLIINDDGVGLPPDMDIRATKSLGTKLILRLAEQIQGTMERSSSDQGTRYVITFPRTV